MRGIVAAFAPWRREFGRTLTLAWPVMLSRAGIVGMLAVDTAMSGHAGAEEIGFYSIGGSLLVPLIVLSVGLQTATSVLTAQADGAGHREKSGTILSIGIGYAVVFGVGAWLLTWLATPALTLFGQSPEMVAGAAPVAKAFGIGMPALLVYATTSFCLEALHRPKVGTVFMLMGNIANVFFNWVFVFGHLGADAMGAEGAAIGTTIVRWLMAIGIVVYTLWHLNIKLVGASTASEIGAIARRYFRIGVPMALGTGLESTAFAALMLIAGSLGPIEVGAYTIAHNLNALAFMFALGLSTAAAIRTGNAYGRNDAVGLKRAGLSAVVTCVLMLAIAGAVFTLTRSSLPALYTTDAAIAALAVAVIPLMAIVMIPDGTQVVIIGALRGANHFWDGAIAQLIGFWIVMVPLAWYLGVVLEYGAAGILVAVLIGATVTLLVAGVRLYRTTAVDLA